MAEQLSFTTRRNQDAVVPSFVLQRPTDSHLQSSRRMILEAAEWCGGGNCLVVGAGECREIPLRLLAENFPCIVLYDVDGQRRKIAELFFPQSGMFL